MTVISRHLIFAGLSVLIFWVSVFVVSTPLVVSAQTPCGLIVDAEGVATPIENCSNPFNVTNSVSDSYASYGGTKILDGGTYEFSLGEEQQFFIHDDSEGFYTIGQLFFHRGDDYLFSADVPDYNKVDTYLESLSEEEREAFLMRPSAYEAMARAYAFDAVGTYTLVLTDIPPPVSTYKNTNTWIEKIQNFLLPVAYAQWFEEPKVHTVTFTVTAPEAEPTGASSVLFLPGLEASRLYVQDTLSENKLWEPNWYTDVQKLYLNESGESIESGIYTRDVIDEAPGLGDGIIGFNIYKKFIESMNTLVTEGTIAE